MIARKSLTAALLASTLLGGAAIAAEQAARPAATQETPAQKAAEARVGKLSKDGAQAFRDMHLARIAIFEAEPAQAKDLIGKAQAALTKAKTDEAVFMKAEADLRSPAGTAAQPTAQPATKTMTKPDQAAATPSPSGSTSTETSISCPPRPTNTPSIGATSA